MWTPFVAVEDGRDRRLALWLRVAELLLTALLIAVTAWNVLSGGG